MKYDPMSFTTHVLPSGLRLFFQHRPLPFTGCKLAVHAGSRHDPPGKEELMHLLEHLLSSGTKGRPKMSLIELERWLRDQRFHCELGETHLDYCAYGGKAANERFEPLLRFLHDLTLEPALDSDLEKERDIIRREREEAASPEERETDKVRRRAVYGAHRLAQVESWAEDAVLDGLTLDDAREAHARYYDPANMTLTVVGGADEDEVLRAVSGIFVPGRPDFVPTPRPEPMTFAVPDPREYRQPKEGRVTKVEVRYLWHFPPGDRIPLIMIRNALSETLLDRIREKLRASYSVSVDDHTCADHRIFSVVTQVAPKKVDVARAIIEEAMADVPAVVADLPARKDEYRLALEFLELDADETLERATGAAVLSGRTRSVADFLAALDATTEADVARLMAGDLAPGRAYVELVEE
ncbi:MAG TPA: insulinase family protein [Patescibacteria group bacterium]|nr:insulinase family protein [Patescibacteria group bacterium]